MLYGGHVFEEMHEAKGTRTPGLLDANRPVRLPVARRRSKRPAFRGNPRSRAATPPARDLRPVAAQPHLYALAVLAATATAAAALTVRGREERPSVPPSAAAGRAAAERVHAQ